VLDMPGADNGWTNLVLQQLEALTGGIEGLRSELQDMKTQLIELKAKEDRVQDLKSWKEKIDDVASPTQLRSALQDVEDLKTFKTKAITIFTGVQVAMGLLWTALTYASG
tara:strand:+ start:47 stop:376 length:330 start_codon:yes stop_codon:yes gene_type:complete